MKKECNDCEYFTRDLSQLGGKAGQCYRFPPIPITVNNRLGFGRPVTQGNNWCGEWKVKEKLNG